jgi:integrase
MQETTMRIAGENQKSLPRKINFTVASLEKAACPTGKDRVWLYDLRTPALALMITDKGAKAFYVYRKVNGMPQRVRLGGFPDITIEQARKQCAITTAAIAQGIDPMQERRAVRRSMPLQELFDRYTKDHAALRSSDRTRVTDKSRFDTCFEDWTARKLSTITDHHVREKHIELGRTKGQVTANRAMQLLRRMFNWARIEPNPVRNGVVDFFKEYTRDRFVQADELPRFIKAVNKEPNADIRDYVLMSLWTGARRSNVVSMRWDELNLASATWAIPAEKAKAQEAMKIHLSEPALEILGARQNNGSEWVFPSRGKSGHLEEPKAGWKRILKAANITNLHLHDLRRTLGSWQAAAGASLLTIGKSLGHTDTASTAIYSRLNLDDVRNSVDVAVKAMQVQAKAKPKKKKVGTLAR